MSIAAQIMRPRIYFAGVGGQGTLTATKLLAQTSLDAGVEAVAGEVHGMAQRGGVVESALLLGGWRAPKLDLGEADILLGFEPLETLRGLPYLKPKGVVFSSLDPIPPLGVCLGEGCYPNMKEIEAEISKVASQYHFIPCREIGARTGTSAAGNSALLGAVCASGHLPIGLEDLLKAIMRHLPAKMREANITAANRGASYIKDQV